MSVFDNVAFQMREHTGLPEEIIHDLVLMKLHAVGLRGTHNLMPSELSGGMARRVALARAIALDPMLIMYDEPFAGLDPISLTVVGDLIRRLNDALGATSIIVTHDVQESLKIVDYVYFVAAGFNSLLSAAESVVGASTMYTSYASGDFLNQQTDVTEENGGALPQTFDLAQNYPNPFNPRTEIRLSIPRESHVRLVVYDILGQTVKTLVDGGMHAGSFVVDWDGTNQSGTQVSSGMYFYRLTTDDFTATKKMVLLK